MSIAAVNDDAIPAIKEKAMCVLCVALNNSSS